MLKEEDNNRGWSRCWEIFFTMSHTDCVCVLPSVCVAMPTHIHTLSCSDLRHTHLAVCLDVGNLIHPGLETLPGLVCRERYYTYIR